MILKTDQPEGNGHQIFLAELYTSIRFAAGFRIRQALWLHWAKSQSVDASPGQFLERQTGLKPLRAFKSFDRNRFRLDQLVVKHVVLLGRERAIDIVVAAFAIAGGL